MRYGKSYITSIFEYRNPGREASGVLSLAHRLPQDYGKERDVSHSLHGLPEGSHAVSITTHAAYNNNLQYISLYLCIATEIRKEIIL
jgi:hypothetical protein